MFTYTFFEYSLLFETKKNASFTELIYKLLPALILVVVFPYIGADKLKYIPLLLPEVIILVSYDFMNSLLFQVFTVTLYYFTGFIDIEILIIYMIFFVYVYFLARYTDKIANYIMSGIITIISYVVLSVLYQYMTYEKIDTFTLLVGIVPMIISVLPLYINRILKSLNSFYLRKKLRVICDDENELVLTLMSRNETAYFHSLRVADVSMRVARELKANVALVNAGARFHEIGKLKSSNYVADGIEMMKKQGFPKEVINIVKEHNSKVNKPTTIESAIVMLADSIETTMSTIKETRGNNFNQKKIVESIIDIRFDTGMLDYAIKDLKKLKKIRRAFKETYEHFN
jgi:putative nucleotidyltransferase with HDIG domain